VRVAHFPLDLGAGHEGRHRVDDDDVHGAAAHELVSDFQGLLARVRLGDEQVVDVHAEPLGVFGVHGVLGVDVGRGAAQLLGLGHHVQAQGRLARGLGPVNFNDAAARQSADAQDHVQRQGARGDHVHLHLGRLFAQLHNGLFAVLFLDGGHGQLQRLQFFVFRGHRDSFVKVCSSSARILYK
jgi:hypothetical protein